MQLFTSLSRTTTGTPDVSVYNDDDLQIYPTGVSDGPCLIMSGEAWDELVEAVAAVRARRKDSPGWRYLNDEPAVVYPARGDV